MACESCKSHTRTLVRAALRAGAMRAPSRAVKPLVPLFQNSKSVTVRNFSDTGRRSFLGGIGGLTNQYKVVGATDRLFKLCANPADYYIAPEVRKKDQVERLEDGEEVGSAVHEGNVWHHAFNFRPTFSTWSHVTMLHLYLLNTRIRCFERDEYRTWQQQLIDHFFFECEKKMHVEHSISSSALRQRYLKDILVQWRGLVLAYDEGLAKGDAILASAVWRNLFKGTPDVDPRALVAVVGWIRSCTAMLEATSDASFTSEADKIFGNPVESFWPKFESTAEVKDAARAKPITGGAQAQAAKPVQAGKAAKV